MSSPQYISSREVIEETPIDWGVVMPMIEEHHITSQYHHIPLDKKYTINRINRAYHKGELVYWTYWGYITGHILPITQFNSDYNTLYIDCLFIRKSCRSVANLRHLLFIAEEYANEINKRKALIKGITLGFGFGSDPDACLRKAKAMKRFGFALSPEKKVVKEIKSQM